MEKWNEEVAEFARNVRVDVAKVLNRTNDSHIGGGILPLIFFLYYIRKC